MTLTANQSTLGCILCDGQSTSARSFLTFEDNGARNELLRCSCGLIYLKNVPDKTALCEHYKEDTSYVRPERFKCLKRLLPARCRSISLSDPRGAVLDIGFGNAAFLDECREMGLETWGIELSPLACERAEAKGHRVLHGSLDSPATFRAVSRDYFQYIILSHIVEHLPDPIGCLRFLRQFLREDGTLIVVVPNANSRCFQSLKTDWGAFHPDHLFYFNPTTLARVLENAGYRVVAQSGKPYFLMNCRRLKQQEHGVRTVLRYALRVAASHAADRFDAITAYAIKNANA